MSWAGCYTLDLYCDKENDAHDFREFPHQFTNELGSVCKRIAQKRGWIIKRNGDCICPKCSGKVKP